MASQPPTVQRRGSLMNINVPPPYAHPSIVPIPAAAPPPAYVANHKNVSRSTLSLIALVAVVVGAAGCFSLYRHSEDVAETFRALREGVHVTRQAFSQLDDFLQGVLSVECALKEVFGLVLLIIGRVWLGIALRNMYGGLHLCDLFDITSRGCQFFSTNNARCVLFRVLRISLVSALEFCILWKIKEGILILVTIQELAMSCLSNALALPALITSFVSSVSTFIEVALATIILIILVGCPF